MTLKDLKMEDDLIFFKKKTSLNIKKPSKIKSKTNHSGTG